MKKLIRDDEKLPFGFLKEPVEQLNFLDYTLKTPFGRERSRLYKRLKFNRFNFVGLLAEDFMAGVAVVDLGIIKNGFAYHFNRKTGELTEASVLTPFRGTIRPSPEAPLSRLDTAALSILITEKGVQCTSPSLSMEATFTAAHPNPLRLLTQTGYRGWTYTDKRAPIPVKGSLTCNGRETTIESPDVMALTDWSAGYMRRETFWSWASAAAQLNDGTAFGMNLAAGVNETGFTENVIWIDNTPIHVGPVHFEFKKNDTESPWHIVSMDQTVDLTFSPEGHREEKTNAIIMGSLFTQLCGSFTGTITPPEGSPIAITRVPGFCEDHFARW